MDASATLSSDIAAEPDVGKRDRRRGMRRPRRDRRLELSLHSEELRAIESMAISAGHSPSSWLRYLALTQRPPAARETVMQITREGHELYLQLAPLASDLRGLASNLNQLVQHLNEARAAGRLPDLNTAAAAVRRVLEVDAVVVDVRRLLDNLRTALTGGEL